MKRKLELWLITSKPYTKFQLNTSKHDEKKCEQENVSMEHGCPGQQTDGRTDTHTD